MSLKVSYFDFATYIDANLSGRHKGSFVSKEKRAESSQIRFLLELKHLYLVRTSVLKIAVDVI